MVLCSMFKEWVLYIFFNVMDYWMFWKMFIIQLVLIGFVEFVLYLNRFNFEMLQIVQDIGKLNVVYFWFDINDVIGDLDVNCFVLF